MTSCIVDGAFGAIFLSLPPDPEVFAVTDQFGVDAYRWYFLRAIPYGQNGSFSWEDLHTQYTTELGNEYGNL